MTARKNTLEPSQIDAIEGRLAGTLKPVAPPREFVQGLRGRIRLPEASQLVLRIQEWRTAGLAVGAVLSGAVLIMTFARTMYHLLWRRSG